MVTPAVHHINTEDGWQLAAHYFPAKGKPHRHPVLMVHGLAANRLDLDLDERHSIARAARRRGFNVYVLELRGAGLSLPPGGEERAQFEWSFLDFVQKDLMAAVPWVLNHAQVSSFHALGHSMGGMVYFAYAVQQPPALRSIAAVGVPLIGDLHLGNREKRLLQIAASLAEPTGLRRVPLRKLLGTAGRFVPISARLADGILLNSANTEPEVVGRLARESIHDIPLKLLTEITNQMTNGHAAEGAYAYEAHLDRIKVPILALAGSADHIAPPKSVAALVARLDSPDIRHREMGVEHGDRADYGHLDLLVGKNAPEEVFPLVLDFLEEMD